MSIEAIASMAASSVGAMPMPLEATQVAPGVAPSVSFADVSSFQGSMTAAAGGGVPGLGGSDALSPVMKSMFTQLEKVNGEARNVSEYAKAAEASGMQMSPGEVVNLTMKCHEFMFHCQLTSNIANRTSDGIQQLFRQQS